MELLGVSCGIVGTVLGLWAFIHKARFEQGPAGSATWVIGKELRRALGQQEGVERELRRQSGSIAFAALMMSFVVVMLLQGTGAVRHISVYVLWAIGWGSFAVAGEWAKRKY